GVRLRVLLDPNKDAFGREKNGVPNRPVAHELMQAGATVRWCDTHGEQCHAKWLMHRGAEGQSMMLLGSTNLT
ncbi:MAG TPA: phospholipase, partial [Methylophaga sp.]|nr:phospholipase [Methylophaga sp.]